MFKSIDSSEQSEITDLLTSFFKNDLREEICNLRVQFREPLNEWFINTRDEIQRVRTDDELHYKLVIDILSENLPELRELIAGIDKKSWHQLYRDAVVKACSSLPEEIEEVQGKHRFFAISTDSIRVKTGKFSKRIGKIFIRGNFRRKVYVRQLVSQFLLQKTDWLENFAAREYDEYALMIDHLLEKSAGHSIENPVEQRKKKYSDFKVEIFLELEDHLQNAVHHLKQAQQNNEKEVENYLKEIFPELYERAEKAGTFEYRQKKLTVEHYSNYESSCDEKLVKQKTVWLRFLRSQLADLRIQAEIARYGFIASSVKDDILKQSHDFFRDTFYLPIEEGIAAINQPIEHLHELKTSASEKGIEKKLDKLRKVLNQQLQDLLIQPMQDRERLLQPLQLIQNMISNLQVESRHFSDEVHLAKKRESKHPIPELLMDTIRWQSLAARFLKEEALKKLDPSLQNFDKLLYDIFTEVEDAVQISDVNFLAAMESKQTENQEETPLQIALDGLERAMNTLEKAIKQVRIKQDKYQAIVKEKLPTAMHSLAQTMLSRDFDRFEMQDKALMVKEQAINWKQKISSTSAATSEKIELGWRFFVIKFRTGTRIVSPYLGFRGDEVISLKEKRNLAEYLAQPGINNDLPFIYKRLFNRDFPIDERFYVAPEKSMEIIHSSYDQWKRGLSANVAIVGEKGSGKTTMIRFARQTVLNKEEPIEIFFDTTFTEEEILLKKLCEALGFKPTDNRDEFLRMVDQMKTSSVVIVENLQNIFIRNINGYEALEAFWVIMSSTMDKLYWVVSLSRYSWNFFVKMANADQYFSHMVFADQLDEWEISETILTRHKSTGYELYFEAAESLKSSRAYKKLAGNEKLTQELIRDTYFSKLSKICEGNTSIAMIFWLQSIKEFDTRRFVFQPLEVTDVDKLEVPSRDVLFTLAALVIHDTLTKEEVAKALHQDLSHSRLMLARLKTKGIVYENKSGYNLNHLVYRQVVRLLKRKNIIH